MCHAVASTLSECVDLIGSFELATSFRALYIQDISIA